MITIYHNLGPGIARRLVAPAWWQEYCPAPRDLELAGVVPDAEDLAEAFDRVIHRDGENWTDAPGILFFGDPRGRRSTQEGDVFVRGDGTAHLVLPLGFRALPDLRLPFLPSHSACAGDSACAGEPPPRHSSSLPSGHALR